MAIVKTRTFWLRVQEAMKDAGLPTSQKAVADLLGIKQPSVNKWAKGGKPTMDHVITLSVKLKVCVEWLYTERGPKRPMDKESARLLDLYQRLNQRQRDKALAYLEGMLGLDIDDTGEYERLPRVS